MKQNTSRALLISAFAFMVGCSATQPPPVSSHHLNPPSAVKTQHHIPTLVTGAPTLPMPKLQPKQETYTVVVSDVPAAELLFSLARDAALNVDIHPNISGQVTLNAIDQTLPQILERIAKQVSLRYQIDGQTLVVEADAPYWKNYAIDYVNMNRETISEVGVATQISTAGGGVGKGGSSGGNGNISSTKVTNSANSHFWSVLEKNVLTLIGHSTEGEEGASPIAANPMAGIMSVLANHQQQRQVQAFIDQTLNNVLRQVLIEMTIVEVELGDRYQAGVDWQQLVSSGTKGLTAMTTLMGSNLATPPAFSLNYSNNRSLTTSVRMLESFGDVKVLSSPKIMALNNQTALLKVVNENVYFTVDREVQRGTDGQGDTITYTSEIHTVPVGLVMSVTPQINDVDNITLSIRPTISRITGYAIDPVPRLIQANFDNLIPEIQVREMESLLQIASGQMVVMGGLMQNKIDKKSKGVPLLSSLPWIGSLFSYKDDSHSKTELVIFLRPTVIKGAGAGQNLHAFNDLLLPHSDMSPLGKKATQ